MAASALEEKINKIRQQNEEIRRRHEEVEEDKKNAAKLNALVQMVPSTDWPERKEPPEFANPPRTNNKPKSAKEHHEPSQQYHAASGEGRKVHIFAQGQGPPPDPKYNFLADAEREEGNLKSTKDNPPSRGQKHSRGTFRRKPGGKDGMQRDYRANKGSHRDEHQPEYEAWRAERNRIDEDRISRQRTAEGNWRREWDNDKVHIVDDVMRPEVKLGDYTKKDHKDFDRRYHINGNDYGSHNRGGNRSYRGNSRHFHNNFHNNYENRSNNAHQEGHVKNPAAGIDERTVVTSDKSIKVMLNQGNMMKGPVRSVKVNSPSIAGTGRVGPRQRSRVTYSSHSDVEVTSPEAESFSRPKSYEDKKGIYHDNQQKSPNSRKSQPPRKKDFSNKSPYFRKKELRQEVDDNESPQKYHETEPSRREHRVSQEFYQSKPPKSEEDTARPSQDDKIAATASAKESDAACSDDADANDVEARDEDNPDFNSCAYEKTEEVSANDADESALQNSDLSESKVETEIDTSETSEKIEDKPDGSQVVQTAETSECEIAQTDLIASSAKDADDNDIESADNVVMLIPCDADDYSERIATENKEQALSTEPTEEITSNNCDSKQSEDTSEREDDVKQDASGSSEEEESDKVPSPSSTDIPSAAEENKLDESNNEPLREKEISIVEDEVAPANEKIDADDKPEVTECAGETQECTNDNDNEEKGDVAGDVPADKTESPKEESQAENEEAASSKVIETVT